MRFVVLPAFAAALVVAACDKPPVEWTDPASIAQPSAPSRLDLAAGVPQFVVDSAPTEVLPASIGRCDRVISRSGLRKSAAAWWSVRSDSSAVLYVSASADSGRTWGTPTAVDTSDVSSAGCRRPPPSLVTVGDDVYVAYSMAASEGTGVFFAHTMSGMVHSPVPVIYGERLVATAIAADARHLVVAYEEPNGTRQQIDVAISVVARWHILFEMARRRRQCSVDNGDGARGGTHGLDARRVVAHACRRRFDGLARRAGRQDDVMEIASNEPTRLRVLVADDDPAVRELIVAVLAEFDAEVEVAADGGEGWSLFEEWRPDLVLLDVDMPIVDGIEVCRRIRELDEDHEAFILFLADHDHPEMLETRRSTQAATSSSRSR